jgi:hypothetical protein
MERVYEIFEEIGVGWNEAQVRLFLEMDANIENQDGKWRFKKDEKEDIILNTVDRLLGNQPIVSIRKILEKLPAGIVASEEEVLSVALESGKYVSPNKKTLKWK